MAADSLRPLSLAQAIDAYESFALALRPATLDPRYVAADASRTRLLRPVHLSFELRGERWIHSLHLADIEGTDLRDASSPYGYGGPLSTSDDPRFLAAAWQAYAGWMAQQNVVVEYLRFHPVLGNDSHYPGAVVDNRPVVWIDLASADFTAGYAQRLRHTLKKASRAELVYRELPLAHETRSFGAFYRDAMSAIGADPFFQFDDAYFALLAQGGRATLGVCGQGDDTNAPWLSAGLFLDGVGIREYHLSASTPQGRAVGAAAFALHAAALSARARGARRLYLGGGSDVRPDNPLLFFKSGFSDQRLCYRTGSNVFNPRAYDRLKQLFPAAWAAHPERPIFYRKV